MADCLGVGDKACLRKLRQRLFGIIAGYEDCNDHDALRDDPAFEMVAGRLPDDDPLASQPTLSRFENSVTPKMLQALIDFNITTGVECLKRKHGGRLPASITLDLDATDDPTHGQQQLTLFHSYYGQFQYFPLIISEPTTRHVFLGWLRPVRGDAGFGLPRMYQVCEENKLTYTFGFAANARTKALTEPLMQRAVDLHARTGAKARLFECFQYKCDSWDRSRTVVAKAECHDGGTNLRFVVTNLPAEPSPADWPSDPVARLVYDDYVERGESEHRMDEMKNGLRLDRLSCHRFMANFFRLLLHIAAYNLLNGLRNDERLPKVLQSGQPCTWRTMVIKVAAEIVQSTRRIVVRVAGQWPWWRMLQQVAERAAQAVPATG